MLYREHYYFVIAKMRERWREIERERPRERFVSNT